MASAKPKSLVNSKFRSLFRRITRLNKSVRYFTKDVELRKSVIGCLAKKAELIAGAKKRKKRECESKIKNKNPVDQ